MNTAPRTATLPKGPDVHCCSWGGGLRLSAAFLGASGELVEVDVTGYVAVGVGHGRRAGGEVFQHRMVPAHLCGQHVLELFAGIGGFGLRFAEEGVHRGADHCA